MAQASLRLTGDKELLAELAKLGDAMARRVVRPAARKALTPISKAMKALAPKGDTGQLKRSIGISVKASARTGVSGLVGARTGFKIIVDGRPVNPVKYIHLVEFGTAPHGGHPGTSARPFMRTAFHANKSKSEEILRVETWKNIKKLVKAK